MQLLSGNLERAKGIEPSYAAWEAAVLPLNYARKRQQSHAFKRTIQMAVDGLALGFLPSGIADSQDAIYSQESRNRQVDLPAEMLGQLQALCLVI